MLNQPTISPRHLTDLALVAASLGCNVALWSRDGSCAIGTIMGDGREDETPDVIATPDGDTWHVAPATPDGEAFLALAADLAPVALRRQYGPQG